MRYEPSYTRSSPDPPLLTRRAAAVRANTFDPATGTFEAVLSTGASVQRSDARGPFLEILTVGGVDPATLANVPLLDTHRQSGGADVIGIIERAWAEPGALVALIRLSSAPDVAGIAHRVGEGTLRGVSIGYRVASWREGTDPVSGIRTRTAASWAIHEASLVPVPADPGATVRSQELIMPDPIVQPTQAAVPPTPVPVIVPPTPAADTAVQTRGYIRAIARSAGLDATWADAQIDSGADVVAARSAAFEAMQARSGVVIRTHGQNEDPATIIQRRMEAVTARVMGTVPTDGARPFMGDRLTDHARAILALRGHSTAGMDQDTLLRAAMHTTSDFPNLLQGVGNRSLLPAYTAAASPLKTLCRRALHTDFRPTSRLRLGEVGPLSKVTEAGEIKYTSRAEAVEGYAIDTYASIFSLSRKAIINDDLGAFRDWSDAAGRAAAETEANLIVGLLTKSNGAGPKMGDGKALFAAEFGNVSAPNGFADVTDVASNVLPAARLAMRMQKGLDGKTPINAAPKYLVVSADLETLAEMVLSTIYADSVEQANPIAGRLTLLVEPRLPPSSFYVFADPANLAVLEYAYLSSAQGPQMSSREGWDVLGVEYRVVLDFGCGALDRRGVYRVPGS